MTPEAHNEGMGRRWQGVTAWQVLWALAEALGVEGTSASQLANAVCQLLPPGHRAAAYPYLLDRLRPMIWPVPETLAAIGALAAEAWHALPLSSRQPPITPTVPADGQLTRVAAAVIERDGRWLLCQRPQHKRHGGLWEFPGGKLRDGEDLFAATRRELAEELGVTVTSVGRTHLAVPDAGSHFVIEFLDVTINGVPVPQEHEQIRWVPAGELLRVPLAPSDRVFAEHLARRQRTTEGS